jgi:hypothetical protein
LNFHHKELGFVIEQRVHTHIASINSKEITMQTNTALQQHTNYDADDHAYLTAKGWTDAEILARWDAEAKCGKGPCRWQTESARNKLAAVTGRK